MGLFSFIKEAGEKLFGGKEVEAAVVSAASNPGANTGDGAGADHARRAFLGTARGEFGTEIAHVDGGDGEGD